MNTTVSTFQTNLDSTKSQEESLAHSQSPSWENKSHGERGALLNDIYTFSEKPEFASGTTENEAEHLSTHKVVSKPRLETRAIRQASEDYLQIIRAYYMKLILQSVRSVQPYAGTPNATMYVYKILQAIRDFEEKSPEDTILELLFAFYDALAYDNQWTTYTSAQFKKAEEVFNLITQDVIKAKDIEKAIATLDDAGFDTIPFQFSLEDVDEIP